MEVCFIVSFRPQEIREYSWDLVCSTERENFIVPLRAIGMRPLLTLPDEIDFGACPIKSASEKKIVIQNIGTSVAKFNMRSLLSEFTCPEQDVVIEAGATFALEVGFTPLDTSACNGDIEVTFSNGVKCYIGMKGYGKNVEVSLSTPSLTLEPSYISLFSQKTLRIRNLSDAPIRYRWKSFATEGEEEAERQRLLMEINRIEDEERTILYNRVGDGYYDNMEENIDFNKSFDVNALDPQTNPSLPFAARVDEAVLIRKYRNLRKALEADKMLFVDDIFDITPIEGEVWAHSEMEITVCFRPDTASLYNCLAFLDVSGRHDRLPLQLIGQGIGPHAALSFEVLDIGDVFVNDINYYDLSIKNKGDIPAQWTFMSSLTRFGNKFQFSPSDGYLLPNQVQNIRIRFESDILGEFSEYFRFALQGNEDMLVCQIKGHVIGPTFHFDTKSINFGTVSFDYLHSTVVRLVNTSRIPMVYNLHIPQDGAYLKKEFNIEPSRGTLAPKESVEVLVEFIPTTVKVYDYSLGVDVLGVGDLLLSVPITAECVVSTVKLDLPLRELEFGDCFIRYPYEKDLKIINLSTAVHTKFEIAPQPKHTLSVASYETVPSVAVIEPGDSMNVKVRLMGQKLGPFKVPLTITIAGSTEPPMQAVLSFNTVGPKVVVDCTELKWGNIECLKDSTRALTITNSGLITANMKLFLKMARSCYRIDVHELILEAQESYELPIIANLDDSVVNKDEIHVVVDEGENLMVPLIAKGIGTTMFSKQSTEVIDLGVQLTNVYFEKQIILENKGRRPQQLKWTNVTVKTENAARIQKAKKLGKDTSVPSRLPKNLAPMDPLFTVTPEEITLRSRTATTFTFRGFSAVPRPLSETFILESKVGKDRYLKQIMETEVKCEVVNPLLEFSASQVSFLYTWEKGVDAQIQKSELIFTNASSISLSFVLKTEVPFNLNTYEHTLQPGQKLDLLVDFDPLYRDDRQSHVVEKALQITYRGHPQKDIINLRGEVVFPNLKFDLKEINFGCILNDTSKVIKLKAINACKIDVKYDWIFLEQTTAKQSKSRTTVFSTPPTYVFDVLPVNSVLHPGTNEDVEFTMLSTVNAKVNSVVVCVVEGGPEYKFPILGESSNAAFDFDKSVLDFGKVLFTDKGDQEITISNKGKVNFNFRLEPTGPDDAKYLEFIPASGKVAANQQLKVIVRFRPGLPTYLKASFTAFVGHFDPVEIQCFCQGVFPCAVVSLPRYRKIGPYGESEGVNNSMWEAFTSNAISNYFQPDAALLPPAVPPQPASGTTINPPSYSAPEILPPFAPENDEDDDNRSIAQLSVQGSTRGLNPQTVDLEMQRTTLCQLLQDKIKAIPSEATESLESKSEEPTAVLPLLQTLISKNINLQELVIARYVCDFGNVIIGQTKKKMFKITNASLSGQLNWTFDKKYVGASGFSIEPEKVQKLEESGSIDFTAKFFARTQQKIGPKSVIVPMEIPGSPTIHIVLTANVCLPEVELTTYEVDFGKILVGRSNKVYVGMKNISPVTATWNFKKVSGNDETKFTIEPASGSLRPNKKIVLCIEFIPTEASRSKVEFALRVDQNKRPKSFKLLGEGQLIPLSFEPTAAEISPVLPFAEGGEKIITISNPSDYSVEVFSLDFDTKYKEEEEVLSILDSYDKTGLLRTAIRSAGEPLPSEVVRMSQEVKDRLAKQKADEVATKAASETKSAEGAKSPKANAESKIESDTPVANEEINKSDENPLSAVPAEEEIVEKELLPPPSKTKATYRDKSLHQDIFVFGPPLLGVSTLATTLSKKLLIPLRKIDSLLLDVAAVNDEVAVMARYFTNTSTQSEKDAKTALETELSAAAEESKVQALDAYNKAKKGKAKEIPDEIYQTPEVQKLTEFQQSYEKNAINISKILAYRLTWQDLGDGLLVDGYESEFITPEVALEGFKLVVPKMVFAHLSLSRGEQAYPEWLEVLEKNKLQFLETVEKSIESSKKTFVKLSKPPKGKTVEDLANDLETEWKNGMAEVLPTGDESWVDAQTGQVMELESHEFKSLEDKEKPVYLRQLLYFLSLQLKETQVNLERLAKCRAELRETTETPERLSELAYKKHFDVVVPLLSKLKADSNTIAVPAELPTTEGESTAEEKKVDSEEKVNSPRPTENGETVEKPVVEEHTTSSHPPEGGCFDILLEGDESTGGVYQIASAILPAPKVSAAEKENALPEPESFQIFKKPTNRPNRKAIKNFRIVDMNDPLIKPKAAPVVEPVVVEDPKKKGKAPAKPTEVAVTSPVVESPRPVVEIPAPTRWMIPPQSSVQFKVRFSAEKESKFDGTMEFEVVGTGQKFNLPCNAICEYPKINTDTKTIFVRRSKALQPANPFPTKRFIIQENFFSFGALALFKKPEWKKVITETSTQEEKDNYKLIESTHSDVIRISNNGRYRCEVSVTFDYEEADLKDKDTFLCDPAVIEVDEGETKELRIWALPKEGREYKSTMVITVKDNPTPMKFPVKCWGSDPNIDILGPWTEAIAKAEEAVKAADKKTLKDAETKLATLKEAFTIDFDRVLIGKTETRSFSLKNTSSIPVAWEIIPEDFQDSKNISFSPTSGIVAYDTTMNVDVLFTSPEAQMLSGKFSLKFSDSEGGVNTATRTTVKKFRVVAEAYQITAVSLNSEGKEQKGSSEIDFGLLRVGDYAVQTLKMGNKGKYKIGYKFVLNTPFITDLVKIEPMEGTIETGNALAEIKLTFCAKQGEVLLKGNSDIMVHISEPTTGEIVEKFPLLLNAQTKFNRFRLQPSKGISFGAVRFDADPREKKAELRNESNFEITYVIMPAMAEHDEIDDLDPLTFSGYAYGLPAATRPKELGEGYLKKVGPGDAKAGGKKESKPPAKGVKGGAAEQAAPSTLNPLVVDPDQLAAATIPPESNVLTVGAFKISPRIATVLPGQPISIAMTFDPSGCETVKEKLRICVSGADPNDQLTQILRGFELVGESCLPALVVDDVHSIFEEQEVVSSLAEVAGGSQAGKIEKVPVGKVVYSESEKLLAFGPVSCNQIGRGVVERVKITNPTKIDIKVKFKVLSPEAAAASEAPLAAAAAGGKGGKDAKAAGKSGKNEPPTTSGAPQAFVVQPELWEIPPHESRFVNIYFNPTEIKTFRSVFIAEIDDEGITSSVVPKVPNSGKKLAFDLGGSGTLPCISIEQPTTRDNEGNISIDFGKVLLDRSRKSKFTLRNDGVMPATCLFDFVGDRNYNFPAKGTSLIIQPNQKEEVSIYFAPTELPAATDNGLCKGKIKISVLNNPFDLYSISLSGVAYASDAVIDTSSSAGKETDLSTEDEKNDGSSSDLVVFPDINLTDGSTKSISSFVLKSRSNYPLKFEISLGEGAPPNVSFAPSVGHIAANGSKDINLEFTATAPMKLDDYKVICSLKKMEYKLTSEDPKIADMEKSLWGRWDDNMKSIRPAYPEDLKAISDYETAVKEWTTKCDQEKAKAKKGKPPVLPPAPEKCLLQLAPSTSESGQQMIYEIINEPFNVVDDKYTTQQVVLTCGGVADNIGFDCEGNNETLAFIPTYIFQSAQHKFTFKNTSNIKLPINWSWENLTNARKTASTSSRPVTSSNIIKFDPNDIPCPFKVEPDECVLAPNSSKEFFVKFAPMDAGDFIYRLNGNFFGNKENNNKPSSSPVNMIFQGLAKRPVCHIDVKETLDYLSRRLPNLKNENGLNSSIETSDLKVVEVESVGLRTRNTFKFYITNTTNESYEFLWETMGEASPFWRCVQSAGMMFPGKRIEMLFEYLPEDINVSEAFYKFTIPKMGLTQIFLFSGKVNEPKVSFSTSKLDFHSVMLGGEGITETVLLENQEHLPFNFVFDKYSLMQLDGPQGPVLEIHPKEGTVPPHGKMSVQFFFKPQEEVIYNYNIVCLVKRKPNKLNINIKGEGYAVHPQIQLEQTIALVPETPANEAATGKETTTKGKSLTRTLKKKIEDAKEGTMDRPTSPNAAAVVHEKFISLKSLPAVNIADFGTVQVLDSLTKNITVLNAGKYNFDYSWNLDRIGNMLTLSGGKLNGTLLKGEELSYKLTFAPQMEGNLEALSNSLSFTVAGKYTYQILPRGIAIKPALKFLFMNHDFGDCFITSPGGLTVVEEKILTLKNSDPISNISVECLFAKIRTLAVECPPTVIAPGEELVIPIRFTPREIKDYQFAIPFLINGTSRVSVNVTGKGIHARLELVNGSQRKVSFGVASLGTTIQRTVMIVNKSKRALPIQLLQNGEYQNNLSDIDISYQPTELVTLQPKETFPISVKFAPNKRISLFNEDLLIKYAGITRTLCTLSGRSQGIEVKLDTDSIPFGLVVLNSQKVKKLTLENVGDLTVNFQWDKNSFGPHFTITPLYGKVLPGNEMIFDVVFKPKFINEDIRQDNMLLYISGGVSNTEGGKAEKEMNLMKNPQSEPLKITCSGLCINPPTENIQSLSFQSSARKNQVKTIKISNPTDKDWYLSPSLEGIDWKVPHEFKVPAKGAGEVPVTYYPLTMATETSKHQGKLFIALPDGTAQLYELVGLAAEPECTEKLEIETPAKKPHTVTLKITNWLSAPQKLNVTVDLIQKACPATFVIVANATEVGPNGTKEFPVRFLSFMEGNSKARITFTNPESKEYCYYELNAKTLMGEVLETFNIEAPIRQTARLILPIENPLPPDVPIKMGSVQKPQEWWTCDSKYIRINELLNISGQREGTYEIEYRPLKLSPQPTEHLITIITQELGTFKYKIITKSSPSLLKQSLKFETSLGNIQTEPFLFRAYNSAKTDYQCAVTKGDIFNVQKSLPLEAITDPRQQWEGNETRLPIQFEPNEIGLFYDKLTIKSAEFGDYECELIGNCLPPIPTGPYSMETGMPPIEIVFRNVFTTNCNWSATIDSTAFKIVNPATANNFTVNSKTESKVVIAFEPKEEHLLALANSSSNTAGGDLVALATQLANAGNNMITAKLFISCLSKPEIPSWVYYLRGKINPQAMTGGSGGAKKK
jgi:hydrocephalus-inducing protein